MRGFNGTLSSPVEARYRMFSSLNDETIKRKGLKSKNINGLKSFLQEKSAGCKFRSLKAILFIILFGSFLLLLYSPLSSENHLHQTSRIWDWRTEDSKYVSDADIEWSAISNAISNLDVSKSMNLSVGLMNFNSTEVAHWHQLVSNGESTAIYLEHANGSITWENLYPEWIDEEEESEVPVCPSLPNPVSPKHSQFNIIAVKLPCNKTSGEWHRDIARFHLQISAAKLASEAESPIHIMFVTECFPIPNLFRGKELVVQQGNVWLYKPDLRVMKEKVQLPIGSCQLSLFLKDAGQTDYESMHRQAYATILHSAHMYVCGAIAAAQSIRMSGSTRDLVILVDETISSDHRGGLEEAGWKVRTIQRIRNPRAERDAYNEWNYSKFRLWQLTDYDKIIFIDADLLILRNIDFLFTMPEISATGNNGTLFNSGVMVIEPSNVTFDLLMDHINEIESYNGGDQGYLNEIFTWWHRIPKHLNFLKHFWEGDEEDIKEMKTQLFGADPPILYVLHYLGTKPWLCFRDYDCNWNVDILQEFASDVAHARWWKVHDAMPEKLQKFCLLRSKQKAGLEWDRRQAEKANYADGHWKEKIHDERLKAIGSAIEAQENSDVLSYWLANSSTLLLLLQRTLKASGPANMTPNRRRSTTLFGKISQGSRSSVQSAGISFLNGHMIGLNDLRQVEAKYPALLFKQQLTAFLEKIYGMIRDNLKKEISQLLVSCIQAPRISRASLVKGPRSQSNTAAQQTLIAHWKSIVKNLDSYLKTMRANFVPPYLVRKVFTQIFSFINVQLFNSLLLRRECCSFTNGEFVKSGLAELEHWCFDATEEYAGSCWDELKHIRQAVGFLVIHQKPKKTLKEITKELCPELSIQQLYRISTMYWDDKYGTRSVSSEVIGSMRTQMTEDTNNSVSNSFLLDDDSSIPFSVDDISKSMTEIDISDVDPPSLIRENSGFVFLLQRSE